jgi:hypothetical protein
VPVSGICANGIISCQPGTWNQCLSFRWDIDGGKSLKLAQVDMPALSGCYCVNNSCGTNLVWNNLNSVLGDLGGGMVGALTTADPRIGVAQAQINGPVIDYVGAQSTACTSDTAVGQTVYKNNPAAIQGDAAAIAAGNSVFQMVAASPAGAGKAQQRRSCTIRSLRTTSPGKRSLILSSSAVIAYLSEIKVVGDAASQRVADRLVVPEVRRLADALAQLQDHLSALERIGIARE